MTSDLKLKPSDVLAKAADLLSKPLRWTKHDMHVERRLLPDCFCAVGAIAEVAGEGCTVLYGMEERWPLTFAAKQFADRVARDNLGIVGLNDDPNTVKSEVVAALRKASTLARSEGC